MPAYLSFWRFYARRATLAGEKSDPTRSARHPRPLYILGLNAHIPAPLFTFTVSNCLMSGDSEHDTGQSRSERALQEKGRARGALLITNLVSHAARLGAFTLPAC